MDTYTFRYKKGFFWKELKECSSHSYDAEADKMFIVYAKESKSLQIPQWSKYFMELGSDWLAYVRQNEKQRIENELGQKPPGS